MGPRLRIQSLSSMDRHSKTAGVGEEMSPVQMRDKTPHVPLSKSQGGLPNYTCTEKLLEGQKKGGGTS